jgi:ABC-type protease/lipase transport system fused ATPase/permease subunit
MTLSGGQRQRIGLARAVFGNPFLVVLDEPNSNLDPLGEHMLTEAVQRMRDAGKIVIIVAHRPSAIVAANKILSLRNGRAEMFGLKRQVLAALFPRVGQPHKPQPIETTPKPSPTITPDGKHDLSMTLVDRLALANRGDEATQVTAAAS